MGRVHGRCAARPQPGIEAVGAQQFVVAADLGDAPLLQHDDAVGVAHGREAVRDDDRRAPPAQQGQRGLHLALGEAVHVGRGLVENQDLRVGEQRACKAQQLALADREAAPALPQRRAVALRQGGDEVVRAHRARGALDVLAAGVRCAVGDVLRHRRGEQEGLLLHHADGAADAVQAQVAHVVAADQHRALIHVVEAVDQRGDAGLARAGGADQRDRLVRRHHEVDAVQHTVAGPVAEVHAAQLDRRLQRRGRERAGPVLQGQRHVEHVEDALAGRHRALQHGVLHRQRADRVEEALHVEHARHHQAGAQLAGQHHPTADDDDDGQREAGEDVHRRDHDLGRDGGSHLGPEVVAHEAAIAPQVDLLPSAFLYRADAVDVLGQRGVDGGGEFARAQEAPARPRCPDRPRAHQRRQRSQRQAAQPRRDPQHRSRDARERQHVADRRDGVLDEFLQRAHVALQPRHEAPDLGAVVLGERDVLQVLEHLAPQAEDHGLREPPRQPFLQVAQAHGSRRQQREAGDHPAQRPRERAGGAVDHRAHRHRDAELRQRGGDDDRHRDPDLAPVRAQAGEQPAHDAGVEPCERALAGDHVAAAAAARPAGAETAPAAEAAASGKTSPACAHAASSTVGSGAPGAGTSPPSPAAPCCSTHSCA
ncbi:MAG: hypothetical protein GAK38_01894 [Xylophilus sp.]|nr:MAG: hypothetical protein GAK38_01894 [Xylophilus sp.]